MAHFNKVMQEDAVFVYRRNHNTNSFTGKKAEANRNRDGIYAHTECYSVACKNDMSHGAATRIIFGIGKYTGEMVTSFNIN
ncbi:MAG: hypothetical protein LBF89_10420 [Bacteroidales bacterium]|nr:hypothetical protein [Bacteroidales bacterium]